MTWTGKQFIRVLLMHIAILQVMQQTCGNADLTGTKSFEEIIERLKLMQANPNCEWIYGRGWDQNDWEIKEFPNKEILDELFPDSPVFLKRVDGHAALINQKALDIAGYNCSYQN